MNRTTVLIIAIVVLSMAATGCMTGLKEGAALAMGAKGSVTEIQPVAADRDARPLGAYQRFELGQITDDIGGRTPSQFLSLLRAQFNEQLADSKLPNSPTGKTLVIRGRIIHYESEDMFGMVTGPLEEVVVRAELVDKDTGKVLGTANCIGRTTARVNKGIGKKAEGLAKAFIKWISTRYPKNE